MPPVLSMASDTGMAFDSVTLDAGVPNHTIQSTDTDVLPRTIFSTNAIQRFAGSSCLVVIMSTPTAILLS